MEELIQIREIEDPDIPLVKQLLRENLWIIDRLFFESAFNSIMKARETGEGTSFVATINGQVVGSISVSMLEIKGEKHALINSAVTAKGMQGKGIARKVLDAVISWLDTAGCRHIYAMVDRYNSRSWNMFIHHGFSPFEFPAQMRRFGTGFLRVWAKDANFIGIGMYFLKKEQPGEAIEESGQLYHHCLGFTGFLLPWFFLTIGNGAAPIVFPYLVPLAAISFAGHEYSHACAARLLGLKTYFRENMPGSIFYSAISLLGGIYPFYGSTYIRDRDWSYVSAKNSRDNGLIYLSGPIISIAIALIFFYLAGISEGYWKSAFSIGVFINMALAVVNLLPLQVAGGFPFDGTKIFHWNKGVWALGVAIVAVSIYLIV